MIGTWTKLADDSWGVRVRGRARPGSIVTVRYKDAREPKTAIVGEVLSVVTEAEGEVSICTVARMEPPQ